MNLTSPAMATAMPNLAPRFIFFIAWAFRLEKVELGCKYSRAKIAGTLLCVVGAILMSLMQSLYNEHTSENFQYSTITPREKSFDEQKIIGAIYLMAAVLVLSSNIVLQAAALTEFPAPILLCATTSLIGAILTTIIQLIQESKIDFGWPFLSIEDLVGYSLLAGVISGGCVTFNTWAMKKSGPVLVSVFSSIGTLVSVVLSANTLETSMSLGSLAGMFIMFTGLYLVLWAKAKEGIPPNSDRFTESVNLNMCHFDVRLSDELGTLSTDLYTPDAEMLLGCDAVQLEQKKYAATIKTAMEDKHVLCFIEVYDRLFKGVNMRTFPIVKLYAYENFYPASKVIPQEDDAETSTIALDDITSDCSLANTTAVQTEFFTPSTKNALDELTHEMIQPSEQDQPIGLKKSLFPTLSADTGASAAEYRAHQQLL